ncbi:DMT family transporter [Aquamicrobium soli]|uniref:DMT family transporter n=1 Tax=Aquamicrobium soli TaxID=1811518 RepID=A0ABV7K5A4_9HYPH
MRTALLTTIAMLAFATNSILARHALSDDAIDPLAFTGIRLVSGAAVLALIVFIRARAETRPMGALKGSWSGAAALLLYAVAFSVAYVMIGAGPGALILFASVQISMIAWAIVKGDRPAFLEWTGMGIAIIALAYLVSPGLTAPPLAGALLMAVAGASWGAYSLIGRGSHSPLADTAGNFIRCVPIGIAAILAGVAYSRPTTEGLAYALASGAIASGLGYIIWYGVLPHLTRTTAAVVQLTVPAIAALGGVVFIGEPLTVRLLVAMAGIIGGVTITLLATDHRRRRRAGQMGVTG